MGVDGREDRIDFGGLRSLEHVMQSSWGSAGTQKLRGDARGLGDSWVSFSWKGLSGTDWAEKRVSDVPDRLGASNQFGFALANHRGTAIERRRHVYQHGKRCETVPFGGLKGSADEGVTDQG
jgi:hypothetical protein